MVERPFVGFSGERWLVDWPLRTAPVGVKPDTMRTPSLARLDSYIALNSHWRRGLKVVLTARPRQKPRYIWALAARRTLHLTFDKRNERLELASSSPARETGPDSASTVSADSVTCTCKVMMQARQVRFLVISLLYLNLATLMPSMDPLIMWFVFCLMTTLGVAAFYHVYLSLTEQDWFDAIAWLFGAAVFALTAGLFLINARV